MTTATLTTCHGWCTPVEHPESYHRGLAGRVDASSNQWVRRPAHVEVEISQADHDPEPFVSIIGFDGADAYTATQARALAEQLLAAADACEV